jgi:membrane protein DedA with SNARE-associated domain
LPVTPSLLATLRPSRSFVLETLLEASGYLGIFVFLVLTGCGLPVPEEVGLVLAGVFSSQGQLKPEWAYVACLLGALVGDTVMYGMGRRFGPSLMTLHPKLAKLIHAERGAYFEEAVLRHGFKILLLARFMVGVRGPVYLAAGAVRMPFRRFLLWDLLCATLVVTIFFGLSLYYGRSIAERLRDAEIVFTLVVLAVVLIAVAFFLRKNRRRLLETVLRDSEQRTDDVIAQGPIASEIDEPVDGQTPSEKREAS